MNVYGEVLRVAAWVVVVPAGLFFALILAAGFIQQVIDWVRRDRA